MPYFSALLPPSRKRGYRSIILMKKRSNVSFTSHAFSTTREVSQFVLGVLSKSQSQISASEVAKNPNFTWSHNTKQFCLRTSCYRMQSRPDICDQLSNDLYTCLIVPSATYTNYREYGHKISIICYCCVSWYIFVICPVDSNNVFRKFQH
jgi:hypothetical protein